MSQVATTGGLKGEYDCIKVFSETDLTDHLKKIDVPTLIIHGLVCLGRPTRAARPIGR